MREYVLMTDSCCDLPDQMAKDLQLEVLPLTMHMDGQDYPNTLDGAAISNEEFYRRIRAGKMATTSAVNVGQFEDAMSAILEQGKDILCISFSSALSTTYQSACIAAETVLAKHPEGRIRVIDSLSASLGQGLLMYLTAHKKLEENLTLDQLGDWVEENKLHVCHWFTVDDLNYLKKGGRVSAATALVGTMLSIKPIMHTSDEGKLTVVGKARGRKSSLNTLVDTVGRLGINLQDQVMLSARRTARRRRRPWPPSSSSATASKRCISTTSALSSAAIPAPTPWACSLWERSAEHEVAGAEDRRRPRRAGARQRTAGGPGHHRPGH